MSDIDLADLHPPAESNPFAYYDSFFHDSFAPPSVAGAGTRLWILVGLLILAVALALALIAVSHVTAQRRGDRLWLYRLVERDATRYIVGNPSLMGPTATLVLSVPMFGILVSLLRLHEHSKSAVANNQYTSTADSWRLSFWPIYFLSLWCMTASNLQAFCLAGGINHRAVSAKVANTIFLGVGLLGTAVLSTLAGIGGRSSRDRVHTFNALDSFIDAHAAAWNGTTYPEDIVRLYHLAEGYIRDSQEYDSLYVRLVSLFAAAPPFFLLVNLTSLALILTIRRQVIDNMHYAEERHRTVGGFAIAQRQSFRHVSSLSDEDGGPQERTRRLASIQKLLVASCILHTALNTLLGAAAVWSAVEINRVGAIGIANYEVLLTLPVWITTCLPILSILYKTMLAFHDMPPRQAASLPSELNEKQQREMEMVQVGNRS